MNKPDTHLVRGTLSDEAIIELYWQRNESAIEHTDKKYKKYLYTIAYNILHDKIDSEDCLIDTYVGTWNAIPPQRPTFFQAFLSKITRNIAVNRYKKNTADKRGGCELTLSLDELGDAMPHAPSAEEAYLISQIGDILNDFIRALDDRDALIFICRYYCADRVAAIAAMLNVSERTVFTRLSAMREELKAILVKEGYFHG